MKSNHKGQSNKFSLNHAKVKLLSAYYGHPERDLRLVCITGSTGKSIVAYYVHEILTAAHQPTAIFASDSPIKATLLHKFFNEAWKAKSTYAVVTAPASSLENDVFYGLPIYVSALTDFIPAGLTDTNLESYLNAKTTLFRMSPNIVILNRDDAYYPDFAQFKGQDLTLTYGASSDSDLRIEHSKLYRKGTEANLSLDHTNFTVASFLTGEPNISYMACAAAIATALNIAPAVIAEGIANYTPEN